MNEHSSGSSGVRFSNVSSTVCMEPENNYPTEEEDSFVPPAPPHPPEGTAQQGE